MKRVKIVTVIDNYGEEKFIVRHSYTLFFGLITRWLTVHWINSTDPFFYEDYEDALKKAQDILENANPQRRRVVTQTNEEEITV
jgi:hypothetical protein